METQLGTKDESLRLDANYKFFLTGIKDRLQTTRIRTTLAVNRELIHFYWQLGHDLIKQQKKYAWGENFLAQFSSDLRQAFPEIQGFSVTNLKRMRLFAKEYQKVHSLWTNYHGGIFSF